MNRIKRIAGLVRDALKGKSLDYTKGSIGKAVFMLAIPMILEMCMESIFAVVDLFFVGHLPNSIHTLQTVSLTESVLAIVYSMAIGISMAATAIVARRIGEKDKEAAATAAVQSLWLALILTAIISVTGFVLAEDILLLMGAEPETISIGVTYTKIMMGGCLVIILLFLINGIFRGAGNASIAMRSLWLANICNIILCPMLINGVKGIISGYGLTGAAIATTIGRGTGVCYQVYHLVKGKGEIIIHKNNLHIKAPVIKNLIKIASPGTLQFIIGSCSWIFWQGLWLKRGIAWHLPVIKLPYALLYFLFYLHGGLAMLLQHLWARIWEQGK